MNILSKKQDLNFLLICAFFIFCISTLTNCKGGSKISKTESNASAKSAKNLQVFLIRHAEKSTNDKRNPDLSPEGKIRAINLISVLGNANITKIYSTDYKRTIQTANPIAKELGLEIELYSPDLIAITDLLKNTSEGNILVVGHSNTTPKLVNKLLESETFEKLDEKDFGKIFVLSKKDGKFESSMLAF